MPACPYCAEPIAPRLRVCPHCDSDLLSAPRRPASHTAAEDAGMRMLLPVGRSGWAIAAGYLGLISLAIVPAPLAVIFSIIAIRHLQKNPDLHGMGRAVFGLVMGVLGSIVLVIVIIVIAANAPQKRRFGQAAVRPSFVSTGDSAVDTSRQQRMQPLRRG